MIKYFYKKAKLKNLNFNIYNWIIYTMTIN